MTSLKGTVILGVLALALMTGMYFFLLKTGRDLQNKPKPDVSAVRELVIKTGGPATVAVQSPQIDNLRAGLIKESKTGTLKIGFKVPPNVKKIDLRVVALGDRSWADVSLTFADKPIELKLAPWPERKGSVLSASEPLRKTAVTLTPAPADALLAKLLDKPIHAQPDAAGAFVFRAPPGVRLRAADLKGVETECRDEKDGLVVIRHRPAIYTATVTDPAGKPVAGAWLLLRTIPLDGPRHDVACTDASGAAAFTFTLPLTDLSSPEVLVYHPAHGNRRATLKYDERRWTLAFAKQEPAPVGGKLVDADTGKPLAGIVVRLSCSLFAGEQLAETSTDKEGLFAFDFAPDLEGAERDVQIYAVLEACTPGLHELKRNAGQILKVREN